MGAPVRVLHILPSPRRGGVQMMAMNLYREINRDKIQFDFVAHITGENELGEEIRRLGGRLFCVPFLSKVGMRQYIRIIRGVIEENGPYAAVHAHTDYQSGFCALAAKKAGVAVRICHAHSDTRHIRSLAFLAKKLLGRMIIHNNATQLCACTKDAAAALYGPRAAEKGRVKIINNGIGLDDYAESDPGVREALLKECGANADIHLIGNVARLDFNKNHAFILDMAETAKAAGLPCKFVIAGSGDLYGELLEKRRQAGLEDTVFFLGARNDVPQLMQSFDAFVLPSRLEGLPLTIVEAQAAGTPAVAADCVPDEADMGLGLLHRLPVECGACAWIDLVARVAEQSVRPDASARLGALRRRGFDAKSNVRMVTALYGLCEGQTDR